MDHCVGIKGRPAILSVSADQVLPLVFIPVIIYVKLLPCSSISGRAFLIFSVTKFRPLVLLIRAVLILWWFWRIVEMIWTRKNRSTGKILYNVSSRWMNDYGELVEWYWQGKLKYWEKNIIQRGCKMNEWVWSIGGKLLTGKLKYWEKNIILCRLETDEWV